MMALNSQSTFRTQEIVAVTFEFGYADIIRQTDNFFGAFRHEFVRLF
jgi:hypothetical protein